MEAKKSFIVNVMFYGIIIVILLLAFEYILPIMVPFIIAFAVSALLHLIVERMEIKRKSVKRIATILSCVVFYAIVFLVLVALGTRIISEAGGLLSSIPGIFLNDLLPLFNRGAAELEEAAQHYDPKLAEAVGDVAANALRTLTQFVTSSSAQALRLVTGVATSIPGLLIKVIITVVSTFFMAIDYDKVVGVLKGMVPGSKRELFDTSAAYTRKMLWVYTKSYTLLFMLTFIELSVGFLILKMPYAIALAIVIAIFDILPILGLGGVLLPWALILLVLGNWKLAAGIAALYLIITAVRQTLEPRIVGSQIGLHPLATLIAMLLGLGLFGVAGLFAFPVTLAVIMAMRRTQKAAKSQTESKA